MHGQPVIKTYRLGFYERRRMELVVQRNEMETPESSSSSLESFNLIKETATRYEYSFLYVVSFKLSVFLWLFFRVIKKLFFSHDNKKSEIQLMRGAATDELYFHYSLAVKT